MFLNSYIFSFTDLRAPQSSWSFPGMNSHPVDNLALPSYSIPQNLLPSQKQQNPLMSLGAAINGDSMAPMFPQMFTDSRFSNQYPYRVNPSSSPASTVNAPSPPVNSLGIYSNSAGLDTNQNIVNGGLTHLGNNVNMLNNQVTSSMVNSTNGPYITTTALNDPDIINHVTSTSPKAMYHNISQTTANDLPGSQSTAYSNIGNTYSLLRPSPGLLNPGLGLHDVGAGNVKMHTGSPATYTDLTNSTSNGYAFSSKGDPTAHNDLSKVTNVMNQIDDLSHARIKLESEAVCTTGNTSPKVWRPY